MAHRTWITFAEVPVGATYRVWGEDNETWVKLDAIHACYLKFYEENPEAVREALALFPTRPDRKRKRGTSTDAEVDRLVAAGGDRLMAEVTWTRIHPAEQDTTVSQWLEKPAESVTQNRHFGRKHYTVLGEARAPE